VVAGTRYGVDLRAALPADAADLAGLLGGTARAMAARLEAFPRDSGAVLVATGWNGAVIGVIALHWQPGLTSDRPVARIAALAVAEEERRNGIGRVLIKAGSQAARQAGCDSLEAAPPEGAGPAAAFLSALGFVPAGANTVRPLRKRAPETP